MGLLEHSGFQTLEFGLLVVVCCRLLWSRTVTGQAWIAFFTISAAGLVGLQMWGESFPVLPLFVNLWRIVASICGAALLGEFLEELKISPGGHLWAHLLGSLTALGGTALAWINNWQVAALLTLTCSFVTLGYCARVNRTVAAPAPPPTP